jgi:hypothetical protein
MIVEYIQPILHITGAVTGLMMLQFLFPSKQAKLLKFDIPTPESKFYFAHWGLLVFGFGVLLFLAADNEALRFPVMVFAALEKAGLVVYVLSRYKQPFAKSLLPAVMFDSVCVILYSWYLIVAY